VHSHIQILNAKFHSNFTRAPASSTNLTVY